MIADITIIFVAICIGFIGRRIYENGKIKKKSEIGKKKK